MTRARSIACPHGKPRGSENVLQMNNTLKAQLTALADRYETADFLRHDPAQFMHRYADPADQEVVGLTAAALALGQRPQILTHMEDICRAMQGHPYQWILQGRYEAMFPDSPGKFYRFYSFAQMHNFFSVLHRTLSLHGNLGACIHKACRQGSNPLEALVELFRDADVGSLVPRNLTSTCKRMNMFLRWMVRTGSPVDLGLWTWLDPSDLLMPVDTHVMHEAIRLHLIDKSGATLATARSITDAMRQIFPHDPCRGDFALFGAAVADDTDGTARNDLLAKKGQKKK
jgi:uncharacterized protein (TIGR02757 family)